MEKMDQRPKFFVFSFSTARQSGQSLIETIIAIFILTMALTTALGLAIYALSSAAVSQNTVIASNLAREGVEVIRMMRDSNWLAGEVSADTTYNLQTCPDTALGGRLCYPKFLQGPSYAIAAGNARAKFDPSAGTWSKDSVNSFDLYKQADGSYTHTVNSTTPQFARRVIITLNFVGFTPENPQLRVISIVGWRGKGCTTMTGSDPATTNCKVIVEEYMTNWKDY